MLFFVCCLIVCSCSLTCILTFLIIIIALLISSFVHLDIRSIFYMLFVLSTIYWGRKKTSRSFKMMYYIVSFLIIYQCTFVTHFPDGTTLEKKWYEKTLKLLLLVKIFLKRHLSLFFFSNV
jgi:hypothetical protein